MSNFNLTEEEKRRLSEMKKFVDEIIATPESEKRELSQALQDRMQNEVEAGYIELTDEQRQKMRDKFRRQWRVETEND